MISILMYDPEIGFDWDIERLFKGNVNLRPHSEKDLEGLFSDMTLSLLRLKALRQYFSEEKVVSFDARSKYADTLRECLRLTQDIGGRRDSLSFEINYRHFTQEQILALHEACQFEHIRGMVAFAGKEYQRIYGKKKNP